MLRYKPAAGGMVGGHGLVVSRLTTVRVTWLMVATSVPHQLPHTRARRRTRPTARPGPYLTNRREHSPPSTRPLCSTASGHGDLTQGRIDATHESLVS